MLRRQKLAVCVTWSVYRSLNRLFRVSGLYGRRR